MIEIVNYYLDKYEVTLTEKEKMLIAKNCKGIPRIANKMVRRIKDFRTIQPTKRISDILKRIGIVKNGINNTDLKYMQILKDFNSPIGLKTISHALLIDENTIENKVEPYLIYLKYINKTFKGRELTKNGINFLKSI